MGVDACVKELNNLVKVRSQYCVQYMSSWFIDNKYFIAMELCSDSLKNILRLKPQVFGRQSDTEAMNSTEYFISCHIFRELLECVQYLHDSNPSIIHRDLKPDNILIASNPSDGRFLKLCDFGLATVHERSSAGHKGGVGTRRYMALEVKTQNRLNTKYDTKVDVYSLGVIGWEIFGLDAFG